MCEMPQWLQEAPSPASTGTPMSSYSGMGGVTPAPAFDLGSVTEGGYGGNYGYPSFESTGARSSPPAISSPAPITPPAAPKETGFDWAGLGRAGLKYGLPAAATIYGASQQAGMGRDLGEAQNQSYQNYLATINPPPPVQEARFNELKSQVTGSAPEAQRRLSDALASRGVRGRGLASPIAGQARDTQQDINAAYRQIYGNYNVPGTPPPVNWAPSTGQLAGVAGGQLAGVDLMKKLYGTEG